MKMTACALLAAALLFTASQPALAGEDVDLGKLACKELTATDAKDMPGMMMWVDGYMSAKSDNTIINQDWMTRLTTHMLTFCKQNPEKTVLDAMGAMPAE